MNRKELEKIPQASQSQNVEDVPDTTPKSEDSSEPSSEGATTESTPYIYYQFASALHWIMATNYAADLIHYLDDFLLAGPPGQPTCSESMETMLRVCMRLGIPVALDKLEGPATTITFLGITINIALQQLRLPPDKLQEMTLMIKSWLGKHKTTKRDLLSLIGKLSCAAKVVPSGRHFLRRLIELSTTVSKLHHHIHLIVEAREDIIWWNRAALASCISFLLSEYVLPVALTECLTYALWMVTGVQRATTRHRMFHASSPPQAKTSTNYKRELGQMLSELDMDHKPSHIAWSSSSHHAGLLRSAKAPYHKDITMRKDSMVVVIKKSKTDQRGENCLIKHCLELEQQQQCLGVVYPSNDQEPSPKTVQS
eukprot:Em0133g5a